MQIKKKIYKKKNKKRRILWISLFFIFKISLQDKQDITAQNSYK